MPRWRGCNWAAVDSNLFSGMIGKRDDVERLCGKNEDMRVGWSFFLDLVFLGWDGVDLGLEIEDFLRAMPLK